MSIIHYTEILKNCIDKSVENGYTKKKENFPFVPEICVQAKRITNNLFNDLSDYYEAEGKNIDINLYMAWCIYAGIAAAKLWHDNWAMIKDEDLYEALTDECGVDCLDEYASELLGAEIGSEGYDSIHSMCQVMSYVAFLAWPEDINDSQTAMAQLEQIGIALYNYGVVVALEREGM